MKIQKIIFIIIALLLLILVPVTVYIYWTTSRETQATNPTNSIEIQAKKDKELLDKNTADSQKFISDTNQENIKEYLDKLNLAIQNATTSSATTVNLLKLRKGILLGINRDNNFGKNIKEQTDILVDVINFENGDPTPMATYISDFAKIALTLSYLECCTSNSGDPYLFTKQIEGQPSTYFDYLKKGYSKNIAKYLALNDFTKTISDMNKFDISNKRNQMDIESTLLVQDKNSLDPKDREIILSDLKDNLDNYISFKPITYVEKIMITLNPQSMYAYSFDIYHQKVNDIDETMLKKIDTNYDVVRNETVESLGIADSIGYNEIQFYNDLRQLYSLSIRKPKPATKINQVVQDILTRVNSSKELGSISENYFKSEEFKNGEYPAMVYFVSLRNTNKDIDSYLKSIGL